MATLLDALGDTMLAVANGYEVLENKLGNFPITVPDPQSYRSSEPPKVAFMRTGPGGVLDPYADTPNSVPIWHYDQPQVNGKVRLENLTALVSGMHYEKMTVCDSIEWGPVSIDYDPFGSSVNLPLQPAYIVRKHFLPEGKIPSALSAIRMAAPMSRYWKLAAKTDQSFEIVFGFQFPLAPLSCDPRPLSPGPIDDLRGSLRSLVSTSKQDSTADNTFVLPSLKVVVVISFVCCTENNDFDPGGVLDAGRIYPFILVRSNLPLAKVNSTVKIARPAEVKGHCAHHQPPPKEGYIPQDDEIIMDNEIMTRKIGSVFFTDRNGDLGAPPAPGWDNMFEYYLTDPPLGSYTMANPADSSPAGLLSGVQVTVADFYHPPSPSLDTPSAPVYRPTTRSVTKAAGQGEFDNLHLAPKMRVPATERVYLPGVVQDSFSGFDNITMAPFCVHDCLHVHTRWSTASTAVQTLGWQGEDSPNQIPGAPLVPSNQKVVFKLLSPSSFQYCAEARGVRPGKWQIFFHHGLAYALNFGAMLKLAQWAFSPPEITTKSNIGKWGLFYWGLRWTVKDRQQRERISWSSSELAKLRTTKPGVSASQELAPVSGGGR